MCYFTQLIVHNNTYITIATFDFDWNSIVPCDESFSMRNKCASYCDSTIFDMDKRRYFNQKKNKKQLKYEAVAKAPNQSFRFSIYFQLH